MRRYAFLHSRQVFDKKKAPWRWPEKRGGSGTQEGGSNWAREFGRTCTISPPKPNENKQGLPQRIDGRHNQRCAATAVAAEIAFMPCSRVRCGSVWFGLVWHGAAWRGMAWHGVAWCGVVWCGARERLAAEPVQTACRLSLVLWGCPLEGM